MGRTIYMKPKFVGSAPRKLSDPIAAPISFVLISSLLDRSLHSLFASCHHHHHLSGGSNVDRLRSAAAAAKIGGRSFKLVMSFPPSLFFSFPSISASFFFLLPSLNLRARATDAFFAYVLRAHSEEGECRNNQGFHRAFPRFIKLIRMIGTWQNSACRLYIK